MVVTPTDVEGKIDQFAAFGYLDDLNGAADVAVAIEVVAVEPGAEVDVRADRVAAAWANRAGAAGVAPPVALTIDIVDVRIADVIAVTVEIAHRVQDA